MKIGDRVKIKSYKSTTGTIESQYTQLYTNNPTPAWNVRLNDGTLIPYYEDALELQTTNSKYQVGDTVKSIHPVTRTGEIATIVNINYNNINLLYRLRFVDGHIQDYIEAYIEPEKNPIPNSITGSAGISGAATFGNGWYAYNPASYGFSDKTSDTSVKLSTGCSHKWKFYFGLQEKYEYCESCNAKRDTDRWS